MSTPGASPAAQPSAQPSAAGTPPLPAALRPAPLWRRLAAMIYDSFLVIAIWILVGYAVLWAYGVEEYAQLENGQVTLDAAFRVVMFSAMLVSAFLFFAFFWTKSGQTLGMQAWKIRVCNPDGSAIGWGQALIRCLLAPLSFGLLGLGYFYMYTNRARYSLHDRLSASRVVLLDSRI